MSFINQKIVVLSSYFQKRPIPLPASKLDWETAVLEYVSDRCGVRFASLSQADAWLNVHPEHPLNQKAIRALIANPDLLKSVKAAIPRSFF